MRLRVRDLQCIVGTRVLIEQLNFEIDRGQCMVLVGPNGSGKTTLLRALAGLARPSQGTIVWDDVLRLYQGHQSGWKGELTARENLVLQVQIDAGDLRPAQLESALVRAGIAAQASLMFARLSAGQRRRLSLARLVLDTRAVWLLDEPATALDEHGMALLAQLIDQKIATGGTVIVSTHQDLKLAQVPHRLALASLSP